MRLRDKVAIVTGAGTGLGHAIALRFGQEGAIVVACGRREAPIRAVAEAIVAAGGRALAVAADVTRPADIDHLLTATREACGRLDVLVNNAGTVVARTRIGDTSDEDFDATVAANVLSVFRMSRAALPDLARARGAVVNVASTAGLKGTPGNYAYAAAKAAVVNMTKTMALECTAQGVRVNAVCPAFVETDLNRDYLQQLKETGGYEALAARHPLGLGTPEDVAWAALYLASDEARWVTGVALPVDGGVMAGA